MERYQGYRDLGVTGEFYMVECVPNMFKALGLVLS